jgi:2-polyprenyl-3-methyl-5-hydroxy-6-metoxy-1,4-benzoquinol methylase
MNYTKPAILTGMGNLDMPIRKEPQAKLEKLLAPHQQIFFNKNILDLGCCTGSSTNLAREYGAKIAIGIDIDQEQLDVARKHYDHSNVIFSQQDLEKTELLEPLVNLADVIISFGTLYHLHSPHLLLTSVAKPHIEYLLIDTLFGPETSNTDQYVNFEYKFGKEMVPKCSPNLAWFIKQLDILGFGIDFVEKYYTRLDFSTITDYNANMRMVMRFFNKEKFQKKQSFCTDQVWQWDNNQLIQEIK